MFTVSPTSSRADESVLLSSILQGEAVAPQFDVIPPKHGHIDLYVCHEGRWLFGAGEFVSCIKKYINHLPSQTECQLDISDSCGYQNRSAYKLSRPDRPDTHILQLLEASLRDNDFNFNGQTYLQHLSIAMGKKFTPSLANLYLIHLDNCIINGHNHMKLQLHYRFLDDNL